MTYTTNQEVPSWDIYQTQASPMYDLNLPEVISDTDSQCFDVKAEDPYLPMSNVNAYQAHQNNPSMLASPSMNMPILCRPYNPYSPVSAIQSMASPSPMNTYAHSPGNSSTYSASPLNSPQQHFSQEDLMMRYRMQQHPMMAAPGYGPRPVAQPASEYAYYYNEYGMKRRKRDEELSHEELEKRRVRRERNKQAALRCRTRRRERIDALEQETTQIEEDNTRVEKEIRDLKKQLDELQSLMKEHDCPKQLPFSGSNA